MDAELQQRAVEYFHLPRLCDEVTAAVLDAMPAFPERESALETLLKKAGEETTDKEVFDKADKPDEAEGEDDDGFDTGGRTKAAAPAETVVPAAAKSAPAPAGRAAAASGGDLEDLLGMGDAPAPPAPAAANAAAVPVTTRIGIDASLAASGQVSKWYNAALVRPAGSVLYEDSYV